MWKKYWVHTKEIERETRERSSERKYKKVDMVMDIISLYSNRQWIMDYWLYEAGLS